MKQETNGKRIEGGVWWGWKLILLGTPGSVHVDLSIVLKW
jgi:hypothetical protein